MADILSERDKRRLRSAVIGALGGIGTELVDVLSERGDDVFAFSRHSPLSIDLTDETSIATAAEHAGRNFDMILDATGFLSNAKLSGEQLSYHHQRHWTSVDGEAFSPPTGRRSTSGFRYSFRASWQYRR